MTTANQARVGPGGAPPAGPQRPRRVRVCGIGVDALTMADSLRLAEQLVRTGGPHQHVAVNAAKVVAARRDPQLRRILESCAIANADGQSIVWAARILGGRLPERVAGIDFMVRLWEVAARRGYRVFLLGAKPDTVRRAAEVARERGVPVVGARSGYWDPDAEADVVAEVARARPDLLFVGLPTPRKEQFLARHLDTLGVPLAVGVGGSFDVVAGEVSRAPRWMQRAGLEWLHRMRQEPRRLARRYAVGNLHFVALVLLDLLRGRARRRAGAA